MHFHIFHIYKGFLKIKFNFDIMISISFQKKIKFSKFLIRNLGRNYGISKNLCAKYLWAVAKKSKGVP